MATLYRKYRPRDFTEVVGQNHIKITLEHEIMSGQLAHAYLFCGPRAVGKTTLARVVAKAVNCKNKNGANPCSQCEACKSIAEGRAMDVIEVDAASQTGVDNVRDNIIASARVTPVSLPYKVFIIDEVHMLSTQAFNALLKIMEEPPAHIIFILCTTEAHKMPLTIISRCQRFDFKKIGLSDMIKKLQYIIDQEKLVIEPKILEAIARHATGHMRDAESLLGQIVAVAGDPESVGGQAITWEEAELVIPRNDLAEAMNFLGVLSKKDAGGAIALINQLLDNGLDLKVFTGDALTLLRQLMIAKINPALASQLGVELGESLQEQAQKIINEVSLDNLLRMADNLIKAGRELKDAVIAQLPLELAAVELSLTAAPVAIAPRPSTPSTASTSSGQASSGPTVADIKYETKSGGLIGYEEIVARWQEFLLRVRQHNHSLSFVLKVCQPTKLVGNKLNLVFKYKFHSDRVNEPAIKQTIENILTEVYGMMMQIETVVDENLAVADAPALDNGGNNVVNNVLEALGGKVIG